MEYETIRKIILAEYQKNNVDTNHNFISRFARAIYEAQKPQLPTKKEIKIELLREWNESTLPKTKEERDLFYIAFHKGLTWMKNRMFNTP